MPPLRRDPSAPHRGTMASAGDLDGGSGGRDARRRGIAEGKRPASSGGESDPDGPLYKLQEAIALASSRRRLRQRLFANMNSVVAAAEVSTVSFVSLAVALGFTFL